MRPTKSRKKKGWTEFFGYDFKVGYYLFYLLRLQFTILSMGTFYIGWVIGTLTLIPDSQVVIGLIVIGPLIGGFTLIYNEYCDLDTDLINPRKSLSPLVRGLINPETALNTAVALAILGIIIAFIISIYLLFFVLILILMGILYSHPAIRLKSIGGIDLIINMVGFGIICPLAGWALARPITEFPILYAIPISFVIGGLYLTTVIGDYDSDKRVGIRSLAVIAGKRNTVVLGMSLITLAVVAAIAEGYFNYLISREIVTRIWPVFAIQIPIYWWFLRKPTYQNIVAGTFIVGTINIIGIFMFLLYHTGAW